MIHTGLLIKYIWPSVIEKKVVSISAPTQALIILKIVSKHLSVHR